MNNILLLSAADSMGLDSRTKMILWIGIAVYMGILLAIGLYSGRKVNDMKDFLVAGRRLPLWMATATLLATWFGAGSSMGVSATVFSDGLGGVLADPLGASLSLMLAGVFIVGLLRKKKHLTVTDIIAERFGRGAGIYASLWMLPVYIGWISAQLLGMGTILHVITGISVFKGTMIGAIVVLIYTVSGGMWAVTLTDVVQVSLLALGLIVIMPFAVNEAGGLDKIFAVLKPEDLSICPGNILPFPCCRTYRYSKAYRQPPKQCFHPYIPLLCRAAFLFPSTHTAQVSCQEAPYPPCLFRGSFRGSAGLTR